MVDVENVCMSEIRSIYVDSLACVIVKGADSEQFRIESGVRQGCIMSPWLFNVFMDALMIGMERRGVRFLGVGREW